MFDMYDLRVIVPFLVALIAYVAVSWYKEKGLISPHKELHKLRSALVLFGLVAAFVYFGLPYFHYYSFVRDSLTLADAQKVIQRQDEALKELDRNLDQLRQGLYLVGGVFCGAVLPAVYNFAKSLVPDNPRSDLGLHLED